MATKVLNGLDLQSQRIVNLASPASATDAVNRSYVDSKINGLQWKQSVVAATTADIDLSSAAASGDVIDGVTLNEGDRILVKNQTDASENGIYVVEASGTPTRAEDADSTEEVQSATVFVHDGDTNADTAWTQTADNVDVGTDDMTWSQFGGSGGATYTFGNGLDESGGTVTVDLSATSGLEFSSGDLQIADSIAGNGLGISSKVLSVNVGDGLEIDTDAVAIDLAANSGLTFSSGDLTVASSIAGNGLTFTSGVLAVGDGNGITVNTNDIAVNTGTASATGLEVSSDTVRIAAAAAGSGLTGGGGSPLAVGAGTGISVGASAVSVDTSTVVRKLAFNSSSGTTTVCDISTLNTTDVTVEVYDTSTGETVLADVTRDSATQVTVTFANSVGAADYRIVIHG